MCDLPPHSRLLNGSDLVAGALWTPWSCSIPEHAAPRPSPNLKADDLSPRHHGADKLTSCSTWPDFHIICGTHWTLFISRKCVSVRGSAGKVINLHAVCKHMWSWIGLWKEKVWQDWWITSSIRPCCKSRCEKAERRKKYAASSEVKSCGADVPLRM